MPQWHIKDMINKYLTEKGLSGTEFAALCGLKQYEVSRVLSGARKASVRIAMAIEDGTRGEITRQMLRPDVYAEQSA